MNKSKQKRYVSRDRCKTQALNWVAARFEVTPQYVYGLLNGNNQIGGRAEEILDAYRTKYAELKQALS